MKSPIKTCSKNNFASISLNVSICFYSCKKPCTDQITLQVGYSARKETTHKPSKVATTKKKFSPMSMLLIQPCFDKCVLLHAITGRHSILLKFFLTLRFFSTVSILLSLKQVFWKKSVFFCFFVFCFFFLISRITVQCLTVQKWTSRISKTLIYLLNFIN